MTGILQYCLFVIDFIYQWIKQNLPFLWPIIDVLSLSLVDLLRLYAGRFRAHGLKEEDKPQKLLELYEFEGCPYCRKVRETLSCLDIDHIVYPCPKETFSASGVCLNSRFRPEVKKKGKVAMFPFLVDRKRTLKSPSSIAQAANTNQKMYQSDDIVKYLWSTYGKNATVPLNYRIAFWGPYLRVSSFLASLARPSLEMGIFRAPARNPAKLLELVGYESSPFVRRVKESLSTLELPYHFRVVPMGSKLKRKEFAEEHTKELCGFRKMLGLIKVPFLRDPNTNVELFESSKIVKYLQTQYQTAPVPAESWLNSKK